MKETFRLEIGKWAYTGTAETIQEMLTKIEDSLHSHSPDIRKQWEYRHGKMARMGDQDLPFRSQER